MKNVDIDVSFSDPDFEISFITEIPNGTPVFMKDAPHIEHIWLDGKVVPRTDEAMLAIARANHKFMPGPDEPRFWLLVISIIMILAGGGKLMYDHFKKK